MTDIKETMRVCAARIEEALAGYVDRDDPDYGVIWEAMRYSLMAGGKRLRPFLVLEFARMAAEVSGTDPDEAGARALAYGCALEMIHTYSLIHDDLPCMDDDDLRRGKPTSHVVFGEANALLAGDALLTQAFEVAAGNPLGSDAANAHAALLLARCAGPAGMIGGQVMDLRGETEAFDMDTLKKLQSLKTGQLIRCAALLGCLAGGASETLCAAAERYAMGIGRAFQVIDDILDCTGDEAVLGKPIGSDAESRKTTFLTFMTIGEAAAYAKQLTEDAKEALAEFPGAGNLMALADYLLERRN